MKRLMLLLCLAGVGLLAGCAGVQFESEKGLAYFEPKPYLLVTYAKDCSVDAKLLMVPGERKTVKFNSGYGSSDVKVELSNGMITSVGQNTDTKIPETIEAVTGLATALDVKRLMGAQASGDVCPSKVELYDWDFSKKDKVALLTLNGPPPQSGGSGGGVVMRNKEHTPKPK